MILSLKQFIKEIFIISVECSNWNSKFWQGIWSRFCLIYADVAVENCLHFNCNFRWEMTKFTLIHYSIILLCIPYYPFWRFLNLFKILKWTRQLNTLFRNLLVPSRKFRKEFQSFFMKYVCLDVFKYPEKHVINLCIAGAYCFVRIQRSS